MTKKKIILIIRDGWGYRRSEIDNAIKEANTPNDDNYMQKYPHTLLKAHGEAVGLPPGYQGNSEVGHMTIGSGRIIYQSLARINRSIESEEFYSIKEFNDAITYCQKNSSTLHLIGLIQIEGVHSHIDHLFALLKLCKKHDFKNVMIHAITDGRDSPVTDSEKNVQTLKNRLEEYGLGKIATISGRYYAMDRDKRWDRTKKAYDCIVKGNSEETFNDPMQILKDTHAKDETDEFIIPKKRIGYEGIKDNDSIIFFNFRTDRTRQLTKSIIEKEFDGWERNPLDVFFVAMTQFYNPMPAKVAFKEIKLDNLLGKVISDNGLKQLRISETEKYAHVTFFFNGQIEKPFPGEERILINSPKVATYDLQPEMSVFKICDTLVEEISTDKYDIIITNLVNGDMVGHTGIKKAIIEAIADVDKCVGHITEAGLKHGYEILVFADHGNGEDQTKEWKTSHTLNPVPFELITDDPILKRCKLKENKGLSDIAPTVLDILGIDKPKEMTGESLIIRS